MGERRNGAVRPLGGSGGVERGRGGGGGISFRGGGGGGRCLFGGGWCHVAAPCHRTAWCVRAKHTHTQTYTRVHTVTCRVVHDRYDDKKWLEEYVKFMTTPGEGESRLGAAWGHGWSMECCRFGSGLSASLTLPRVTRPHALPHTHTHTHTHTPHRLSQRHLCRVLPPRLLQGGCMRLCMCMCMLMCMLLLPVVC